ncbi:MAG: T9SS type A sorting domain-containing protein, partial [Rhodothermales bacterium]|nr:T9SS type A sorting domain-containing protein [Rhodothermales bacterium]
PVIGDFRYASTGTTNEPPEVNPFLSLRSFPNPTGKTSNVVYSLPQAARVTLDVYDLLGRRVATPFDGFQTAGEYEVSWDVAALPPGVYFYRLIALDRLETSMVIVAR